MKKRILIINSHFNIGGIETSMVNMANALCEEYDIDLFIYYPEGPIKERLDPRVNVLSPCFAIKAMGMSLSQALKCGNPFIFLFKLLGSLWAKVFDNRLPIWLATKIQPKMKGYDLAIAYRQEADKTDLASGFVRVLDRCVESKRKCAWIHYDTTKFESQQTFNRKYYQNIEKIVGVSKEVAEVFGRVNPTLADKLDFCYNFMNYDTIIEKSSDEQYVKYPEGKFICFTACRLVAFQKRIVRAVRAIAPVLREHNDVVWCIAGDGPDRTDVESVIVQEGMQDKIILLGNQSNPYPYMRNSDLVMLLSYHEAAPMVYMEAKALHVPIFSTKVLSTDEMLKDGIEDFVCENSEEGIRKAFYDLMANREKIAKAKENLNGYQMNNNRSIAKIEEFINQN